MTRTIDRLCDELRIRLHGMDRRLEALKANGSSVSDKSQHRIQSQMDSVQQRIFDRRSAVETANARVTAWVEEKRPGFDAEVAGWRAERRRLELEARADDTETYALAAFDLALAAVDEAAGAALEALLARGDAASAARPACGSIAPGPTSEPGPVRPRRSGHGVAVVALSLSVLLMWGAFPAQAKPSPSARVEQERRVYSTEESQKLGDEARRIATARQKAWDRKMKAVSGSICDGC
jgi:hypothetical protein